MIVDANGFIGKWPLWPIRSTSPGEVDAEYGEWKIDRAAVCSTRSVFINWEDGNREVLEACREFPSRFIPFACMGPSALSPEFLERPYEFTEYVAQGFKGIRLYPQHHSYHPLYVDFVDAILEDAAERGWPVMLPLRLVMNWGLAMLALGTIEAVVERHPHVHWILSGINYLHELQLAVSLMKRNPMVYLETSCVMGFGAVAQTVSQCGAQQLLFGSGAPMQGGAAAVSKILHAQITDADREAILGKNFLRLTGEI